MKEKLTIEVDPEIKEKVENMYENMGLDIDTAVNLLFVQSLKQRKLPFEIVENESDLEYESWVWEQLETGIREAENNEGRPVEEFMREFKESIYG